MYYIKDILNILGVKKRTIAFDTSTTPIVGGQQTFNITYTGRALQLLYTRRYYRPAYPHNIDSHIPTKKSYAGGGSETLSVTADTVPPTMDYIENDTIYFVCIGVTSLVVNGQTLI